MIKDDLRGDRKQKWSGHILMHCLCFDYFALKCYLNWNLSTAVYLHDKRDALENIYICNFRRFYYPTAVIGFPLNERAGN